MNAEYFLVNFKEPFIGKENNDMLKATLKDSKKYPGYVWVNWKHSKGNLFLKESLNIKKINPDT